MIGIHFQWAVKLSSVEEPIDVVEWTNGDLTIDFQHQLIIFSDFTYNEAENVEYWNVLVDNRKTKVCVGRERTIPPSDWSAVHTEEALRTTASDPVAAVIMWYFEKAMSNDS